MTVQLSGEARRLQAIYANHKRNHPDDDEGLRLRRRAFLAARLEGQIREALAEDDLTVQQVQRLSQLLLTGGRTA